MSLRRRAKSLPLIRAWARRRAIADFLSPQGYGQHFGRFETFAEARAWLPASPEFAVGGFQNEYIEERTAKVFAFDYPVMLWLDAALRGGARTIFDLGGSVGVHYYAYQRYLAYPADVHWVVAELAEVVQQGRDLAVQRGVESALTFRDELELRDLTVDVLLAAGALEFVERPRLPELLGNAAKLPRHLLLNKLPLFDRPTFVSTQNIGHGGFSPHYVFHRGTFVSELEAIGYELVDQWSVPDRRFTVPDDPAASLGAYSGVYLRSKSS